MDAWFCAAAVGVFAVTLLPRLRPPSGRLWVETLAGASLCFISPLWGGLVLLGCSLRRLRGAERKLLQAHGRAVVITGCDSGFGHALAKRLAAAGATVFAGVLDVGGAGAQRLRDEPSHNLQVLQLDVTDVAQVEAAQRLVRAQVGDAGLWGLVNNAGVLLCPADAELQPLSVYRRCMDINFLAAVSVCQAFLPLLRRAGGRVVNVSSLAGDVPMPTFAAYGASKAALAVFSGVLRQELSAWGVGVSVIQPTGFRTDIFGSGSDLRHYRDEILAGTSSDAREAYGEAYVSALLDRLSRTSRQMPENLGPVVDDMCDALLAVRPRPLYTPGRLGWLLPLLHRCCPTAAFDPVVTRILRQDDCEPAGLGRSRR